MTNKQSWGDNWEEEFEKKYEYANENPALIGKGDAINFIKKLLASKSEQMEMLPNKDFEYTVKFEENLTQKEREKKCFMLGYLQFRKEAIEILKK